MRGSAGAAVILNFGHALEVAYRFMGCRSAQAHRYLPRGSVTRVHQATAGMFEPTRGLAMTFIGDRSHVR